MSIDEAFVSLLHYTNLSSHSCYRTESGTISKYRQNSDNIWRVNPFHSPNMPCVHVHVRVREREWSKNKNISKSNSYIFISYSNAARHFLSHILGTMWLWKLFACSCSHQPLSLFFFPFSLSGHSVCVCMCMCCALCISDAYFSLTVLICTRTELRKIIMGRDANVAQFIRLQMVWCGVVCVRVCVFAYVCSLVLFSILIFFRHF